MDRNEGLQVVAFGGGTGLPVLLRGLRDRVGNDPERLAEEVCEAALVRL